MKEKFRKDHYGSVNISDEVMRVVSVLVSIILVGIICLSGIIDNFIKWILLKFEIPVLLNPKNLIGIIILVIFILFRCISELISVIKDKN